MVRKKAVLFDVDGTLLDAWDFVFEAVKYSLTFHGHTYPASKKIKEAVGKSLPEFYEVLVPGVNPLPLAKTHHQYQEENFQIIPFPKTKQTLRNLKDKGFFIAAISNRSKDSLLHSLKLAKIFKYFDVILSAEDVKNPKPHPEHVQQALKKLKVRPTQVYMVGDTDVDVMVGKNAGVKTVAVTYGFAGKDILKHNPDFVIDDLWDLIKIIENPSSFPTNRDQKSTPK